MRVVPSATAIVPAHGSSKSATLSVPLCLRVWLALQVSANHVWVEQGFRRPRSVQGATQSSRLPKLGLRTGRPAKCAHTPVHPEAEEQGHQRVALFAPLTLGNHVRLSTVIFPQVRGGRPIEMTHKRQQTVASWNRCKTFKHRIARYQVIGPDSVD